jgi:molybdate transport system regulatory protein
MKKPTPFPPEIHVRPRIYIGDDISIGPGKIDLLRLIDETRSIAAAARLRDIPYKRAWFLIDTLNKSLGSPVIETVSGGKGGGGSALTLLGKQLVVCYAMLEKRINAEAIEEMEALRRLSSLIAKAAAETTVDTDKAA